MATPLNDEILDLIPWETAPELPQGHREIKFRGGTIRIPERGFIDANEAEHIRRADPQNGLFVLLTEAAAEIAKRETQAAAEIAKREGVGDGGDGEELSPRLVYGFLLKLQAAELGITARLTEQEHAWQVRHSALIAETMAQGRVLHNRVAIASATVMLRRVKPEWSDDQTMRLPTPLISALHAFEADEERAGAPPADPAAESAQLEDALGKLEKATRSIATGHDGPTSSGPAGDSGPAPPSSAANGSAGSPPPTSLRRSRKASKPKGISSIVPN
jgi:hypothetical protein